MRKAGSRALHVSVHNESIVARQDDIAQELQMSRVGMVRHNYDTLHNIMDEYVHRRDVEDRKVMNKIARNISSARFANTEGLHKEEIITHLRNTEQLPSTVDFMENLGIVGIAVIIDDARIFAATGNAGDMRT